VCGFSARSAENGHVQKESTALPKAEHADCISPKKLFEKSGLEGLRPSKYPLFLAGGGRTVVLYFYPKDNTPGCTQESCDFRDHSAAYADKNAVILGISPDSVASHQKFKAKFSLPFLLLADPGAVVAARYGAWGEKNMYGKKSMGLIRSTFVIGGDGRLTAVYRKVSVTGHVDKVLAGLSA
jgi:peroxiredoxin Q/BCP